MVYALIALSAIVVVSAVMSYRRTHWWVYLVFALVWAAWFAVYVFVAMVDVGNYDSVWFGRTIVRPLNVFSFALIAGILFYRWRND